MTRRASPAARTRVASSRSRPAVGPLKHASGADLEDVRPRDWNELQRLLFENTWNPSIARFRSNFVYRGMSDASFPLQTTLMRLGSDYRDLEFHLLRNFKKYARRDAVQENNEWNWLAVAQHHGLPTRMLDFTYSPYVALHFATVRLPAYDRDGVIWCVNYVETHKLLPKKLREVQQAERANAFTAEMLDQGARSLRDLERLSQRDFAIFFEPPSLDERIVNQFALFAFMSNPEARLDTWLAQQERKMAYRIIIPREMKWEIRDKLDQANITERVLFPGLDGLSRWLWRHYTLRQ
jgi:hypothetical protein